MALSFFAAIILPLPEFATIAFTSPVVVTLLSILFLKEVVGRRRWTAMIIGFVGVLIIVQPGRNIIPLDGALIAFGAVVAASYTNIPEIGEVFTQHPDIRKLTFTGSTGVGKMLMAACASTIKRTSMELGGNAPFIVFEDADIDAAVDGVIACKFRNGGQTCVCANRIFFHTSVMSEFAQKLKAATSRLAIGDGNKEGVQIGPMIHEKALIDVQGKISDALEKGADIVLGGERTEHGECFLAPTIVTGVTDNMRLFREEIFGPVAPLIPFDTEEEVIRMANDTEYGLAAYFYARDIGRIWRVSEALDYGMVGLNVRSVSNEMAPFGGVKQSGQGREGSKYGLEDYLEMKYLCMGGLG